MQDLRISRLRDAYRAQRLSPTALVNEIFDRIEAASGEHIFVSLHPRARVLARAAELERTGHSADRPLFGVPFAVKDNIDVAGLPTTAGLPEPIHLPERSAYVVDRLVAAGGIVIGKTNLDQLACGLVGTRSPHGVPRNPYNPAYIPGGSSSGSAVAVSRKLVSFALGTDTAGSGRVPAGFNDLVGLKPSPGLLSTRGVVPACRSLDCVSVFALDVHDATRVAELARGYDAEDPWSRPAAGEVSFLAGSPLTRMRLGIPRVDQLEFFGDAQAQAAFERALGRLRQLGAELREMDFAPLFEIAQLLYTGPWLAERVTLLDTLPKQPLLPVLSDIFSEADRYDARDAFRAQHQLAITSRNLDREWSSLDALLVPTSPTIYTVEQVEAEPRALNTRLGRYTNFVNLLRLAAIAVPSGFRDDGLPTGITLIGPCDSDAELARLATLYRGESAEAPAPSDTKNPEILPESTHLAVVGAHLSGQPLNHELTRLGARLLRACRTSAEYRLYALEHLRPPKPGLVRASDGKGHAIELEVWELPAAAFGSFMTSVRAPLCIGTITLDDGSTVLGFLCEAHAVAGARDISQHGGWRAYLNTLA
ncbi:MAG TPA: allophanate hydrolase [Polyangiaceae bacterium]